MSTSEDPDDVMGTIYSQKKLLKIFFLETESTGKVLRKMYHRK